MEEIKLSDISAVKMLITILLERNLINKETAYAVFEKIEEGNWRAA